MNIRSVDINMALKTYLIYYLDIIPAIQFLIDHFLFASHMAYAPVKRYPTDNLKNHKIVDKDKQIYGEMHIID